MNSPLLCVDPPEAAVRPKPNGGWVSLFTKRLNVFRETNLSVRLFSPLCCLLRYVDLWDSSGTIGHIVHDKTQY